MRSVKPALKGRKILGCNGVFERTGLPSFITLVVEAASAPSGRVLLGH